VYPTAAGTKPGREFSSVESGIHPARQFKVKIPSFFIFQFSFVVVLNHVAF
jgi:hypothetical protein